MSQVIALIPARSGSKGIPGKSWRQLGDLSLIDHALLCARRAGIPASNVWLSTDGEYPEQPPIPEIAFNVLPRPMDLALDTTPMLEVVTHALAQKRLMGAPDDVIVLLQPTQPFRTPAHVTRAIQQLRETQADSVVSVVEAHPTHHVAFQLRAARGGLVPWLSDWAELPTRRQAVGPTYLRDGTVYAFWRRTATTYGTIYGEDVRALVIAPEDTCKLDTEADWADVTRRWDARLSKH